MIYCYSCTRTPTNPKVDHTPVINILLKNSIRGAYAELSTRLKNDQSFDDSEITKANIRINKIKLDYNEKYRGAQVVSYWNFNYYTNALAIHPGKKYNLYLETQEGFIIRGQTTVPDSFRVNFDNNGTITWGKSTNAKYWMLKIVSSKNNIDIDEKIVFTNKYKLNTDKLEIDEIIDITINAFDENFYNSNVLGQHSSGIDNGIGTFASSCEISGSACYPVDSAATANQVPPLGSGLAATPPC